MKSKKKSKITPLYRVNLEANCASECADKIWDLSCSEKDEKIALAIKHIAEGMKDLVKFIEDKRL